MYPVHLTRLTEHVIQNGMLESHRDVPLDLQHQLIVEDRERRKCRGNQVPNSGPGTTSVNIRPGRPQQTSELSANPSRVPSGHHLDLKQNEGHLISQDGLLLNSTRSVYRDSSWSVDTLLSSEHSVHGIM